MKLSLRILPSAEEQLRQLIAWWRENRPTAPTLLEDELRRVFELLAETPNLGTPYPRRGALGLRRYRLKKTPYCVYYMPSDAAGELLIAAVWSSMRKKGPPIRIP